MTTAQLEAARRDYAAATERAERADHYGDHTGATIARADARGALRRLRQDQAERVR